MQGGCYDEGGNGIAFRSEVLGPSDARLEFRKAELGSLPEAVEVGGDYARWVTYEVEVTAAGEYDVEMFMNRPDYSTRNRAPTAPVREESVRLNLGGAGTAGKAMLEWKLATTWNSGTGWRSPQKSLGKQTVRLPAGRHKLVLFCDEISVPFTFFCKAVFTPVAAAK